MIQFADPGRLGRLWNRDGGTANALEITTFGQRFPFLSHTASAHFVGPTGPLDWPFESRPVDGFCAIPLAH